MAPGVHPTVGEVGRSMIGAPARAMTQAAVRAPVFPTQSDPSRTSKRVVVAVVCVVGAAVAMRLAAYQLGWCGPPWEPLFGDGTRRVLESRFSRSLPFSDAAAGAVAYLVEAGLALVGGHERWKRARRPVFAYGAAAAGMAIGSVGLVLIQAFVVHAFCTLCLVSALISFGLVFPAWTEVAAAWRARRMR